MKGESGVDSYPVGGIELRTEGDDLVVRFEHNGEWYEGFREGREGPIGHCLHANGIKALVEGEEV